MMNRRNWIRLGLSAAGLSALPSCEHINPQVQSWANQMPNPEGLPRVTPAQLYKEVGIHVDLLPKGKCGRMGWKMQPRYITIHCTENRSRGADAFRHALALKRGALKARRRPGGNRTGYLTWHFTVQDNAAVQHLPTREQGEHADFNGPGNNFSIGIEMCENVGNNMAWTVDRTARLAAYLMYAHAIPLNNVVPHYHWPRVGSSPQHKNCPHFLLNNGKPGATWRWFQSRVHMHYSRLVPGPVVPV